MDYKIFYERLLNNYVLTINYDERIFETHKYVVSHTTCSYNRICNSFALV